MSEITDALDEMLRDQEGSLDNPTFIYNGLTWPCVPGGFRRGMALGLGPPTEQLGRTLRVRKSAIPSIRTADQDTPWSADSDSPTADNNTMPPHPGKMITFEQRIYEVEAVDEDGAGAAWIVHLVSPNS